MTKSCLMISGPTIYTEQGALPRATLTIQEGIIQAIAASDSLQQKQWPSAEMLSFPEAYHLVPGFIDLHVHGANGHDVMDATPEALAAMSESLAADGTTAFLATTMTADIHQIENSLCAVRDFIQSADARRGAAILGVHLEGPFLSPTKMGAQRGDKIISPDIALVTHWQHLSNHLIKLVTLAPEQPHSLDLIHYLKQQNIIASIGHTNATYAEAIAAIDAGCCYTTHLFNAMRGMHHREPGAVTAALLADNVMAELIVDGIHLHPAIVKLALKIKGKDNVILVTDAMRAKCLGDGCYDLGGQTVHVKSGQANLADGTLAGSTLPMFSAIQNTLTFTGCELADAVKMASANPAKALGLFHQKGSIAPGKDADIVVLDENMNVVLTLCGGKMAYRRTSLWKFETSFPNPFLQKT